MLPPQPQPATWSRRRCLRFINEVMHGELDLSVGPRPVTRFSVVEEQAIFTAGLEPLILIQSTLPFWILSTGSNQTGVRRPPRRFIPPPVTG